MADTWKNVALGAAAGAVGTLGMQGMMVANSKLLPDTLPRMKKDPGMTMVKKTLQGVLPKKLEKAAARSLGFGYGATAAGIYAAFRSEPSVVRDGALLGLGVWAAGYLGWLPAMGITRGVHKQKPAQVVNSMVQHVAFGVLTVSAYQKLRERLD